MKSDATTRPRITLIPNNPNLEEVICEVGEPTIRFHLPTRAMYLDLTTGIPIVEIYGSSYLADEETEKHPTRTPLEQVDCQVLEDDQLEIIKATLIPAGSAYQIVFPLYAVKITN